MATGILSQLRPNGTSGDQFNLRAANIFHFNPQEGSELASGECSAANKVLTVRNDNIVKLDTGMIISVKLNGITGEFPDKITIKGAGNNTIQANVSIDAETINEKSEQEWFVFIYDGENFRNIRYTFTDTMSVSGGAVNKLITANAVKTYVDNLVSNRWKYVVCTASAANIPAGAVYYNGTTKITGTMAASASTAYTIYLVLHNHTASSSSTNDIYDEWITIDNNTWEKLGSTDVDISGIILSINDHSYKYATGAITGTANLTNGTANSDGGHTHNLNATNKSAVTTGNQSASNVTISTAVNASGNYTPTGSINGTMSVSGDAASAGGHTHSFTSVGGVTTDGTANATSNATNAVITSVSGKNHTHSTSVDGAKYTPSGTISVGNSTANYTPSGTVSQPNFTGDRVVTEESATHTHEYTATGSISVTSGGTVNYTPGGTIVSSNPTATLLANYTPTGSISFTDNKHSHSVSISNVTTSGSLTPLGSITFDTEETGGTANVVTNVTHTAATGSDVTVKEGSTDKYISAIDGSNSTIPSLTYTSNTSVGSVSDWNAGTASNYNVTGEVLTLTASTKPTLQITTVSDLAKISAWSAGTASTIAGTSTDFKKTTFKQFSSGGSITQTKKKISFTGSTTSFSTTGGSASTNTDNSATGLSASFNGNGTVLSFNGTGAHLAFTGTSKQTTETGGAHTHKVTATGTVSQPTFSGTGAELVFSGIEDTITPTVSITSSGSDCVNETTRYLKFTGTSSTTETGGAHTHTVTGTASNSADKLVFNGTKVQISGTIADHTHTIAANNITVEGTTETGGAHTHTVSGTIAGSNFTATTTTGTLSHSKKS